MELRSPLFGEELRKRLKERIIHEPIVDSLLYKSATLMVSSQPSVGKSVIAIQAALQMAQGMPVFGALAVPRPMRVWYMQMERPDIESLERLQHMIGADGLVPDTLFIDTELQALNFLSEKHFQAVLDRGRELKPDVIIIDPLYGIATGLSKDEVGSSIAKMFTVLKQQLGCAIWVNHHTVKNTSDIIDNKRVEKDDPFYGAQWLKAHVTGSYLATQCPRGVTLSKKKDSHSILLDPVELTFDDQTYLSSLDTSGLEYKERYKIFLKSIYRSGKRSFFFEDARRSVGCTVGWLRSLHCTPPFKDILKVDKVNGRKSLYVVTSDEF